MKASLLILSVLFITFNVQAQVGETIVKVNQGAATLNQGASTITNTATAAGNTATALSRSVQLIKGFIPEKKDKDKSKAAPDVVAEKPANVIVLTIMNVDYNNLKTVEENVKSLTNVKSTSKKFSTANSTISIEYTGQADELWDALPETVKTLFELKALGDGTIALEKK
ncbi:hypothetical protein [Dyadobacter psychrophilus]|uniref:Uncharacterized protein n=1 Tax=Dyadobacter psychrophilus TaxID=651661 RepID=A0A1T5DYM5_9BACT|nr:hypothetical protein [Dyadobacter psychrophilus]SKB76928.1 hypothetical protein SAMN05660293_02021 [Dyadobacter psychrophilus]